MRARSLSPTGLFALPLVVGLGLAAFWMGLKGEAIPILTVLLILVALVTLLVNPLAALLMLAATRFSFDMAWEQRIAGLGLLDFLGAGVPAGVVVLLLLARPRFGHIPLVRPVLAWVAMVWCLAALRLLAGGDLLRTVETALKFTTGTALFVLACVAVRRYSHALRLLACWTAGTVPVALVFLTLGGTRALDYHGVQRIRAIYHDPGTPAIVASLGLLTSLTLIRAGRTLGWASRYLLILGIWALVLSRVLFQTFSGAMTASTILALATLLVLERRWGLICCSVVLLIGLWQVPSVQQRWWRETSILQGHEEVMAFASGRPHRWKRFLERYEHSDPATKIVGAHGEWGNPENGFLQVWFDLGPIGTLGTVALIAFIQLSLLRWWREESRPERRQVHALTLCVCVGYVISGVTATPFTWVNLQWFLWSCVGASAALRHASLHDVHGEVETRVPPSRRLPRPAAPETART